MTTERNPSLASVVRAGIDRRLAEVRTSVVGVVESYSQGKANVQILRPDPVELEDGTLEYQRGPVVNNVPICFPGVGQAGLRITFPVRRGDFVTLVFSDRELAQWLTTGREVEPESPRTFDVSDAVGFLGPQPFTASWTDDASCITIGSDSGSEDFVALAAKVKQEIQTLRNEYAAHGHNVSTAGSAVAQTGVTQGGPSTQTTPAIPATPLAPQTIAAINDVASTTVKVKG